MCICLCKWMYHICVGHRKWSRHTENLSDFRLHTPKQKYRNPKLNFEQICYGISSPLPKNHKTFANSHGEWTQDNPENCLCSQHSCVNMHVPRTTSFTVFIYSCICIGRHINTLHILPSTVNLCYTRTTFMHNAHICIYLYTHLHNLIATRAHYFAINTAWGNVPHRVAVWHFGQSSLLSTTLPLDSHEARTCPKKARVSSLGVSRVRVYDTNMCVCAVQAADAIQLLSTHTHHTTYSRVSTKHQITDCKALHTKLTSTVARMRSSPIHTKKHHQQFALTHKRITPAVGIFRKPRIRYVFYVSRPAFLLVWEENRSVRMFGGSPRISPEIFEIHTDKSGRKVYNFWNGNTFQLHKIKKHNQSNKYIKSDFVHYLIPISRKNL